MVSFRSRLYRRFHNRASPTIAGPGSGVMTLPVTLAPGESCRAEHGGTYWTVCNDSDTPILSGARARIASVQGLTLLVRPNV
jgi:membrane protein implicated in regulation of membrane protease activity